MKYTAETLKGVTAADIDMFMDMFIGTGKTLDYYKKNTHEYGRFVAVPDYIMPIAIENKISYEIVLLDGGLMGVGYKATATMEDGSHNYTTAICSYPYEAMSLCALMISLDVGLLVNGDRLLNNGCFA